MANCCIDDSFATPLGDGMHNNAKLQTLNLSCNSIGNFGSSAIAKALTARSNGEMREINLSKNSIGNPGGIMLAQMI